MSTHTRAVVASSSSRTAIESRVWSLLSLPLTAVASRALSRQGARWTGLQVQLVGQVLQAQRVLTLVLVPALALMLVLVLALG